MVPPPRREVELPRPAAMDSQFSVADPEEESAAVQLRHVCLEYSYKQLQVATKDFHESCRLGEGSVGAVFLAELQDGSSAAVKVIDLAAMGENAPTAGFEEEIMILSKFRHPNLVVLMGFSRKGDRRFLLYEFLSGGDVSGRLLKSRTGKLPFLWHERLSVLRDSATGLAHLHNAVPRAFHRDIKCSNILLGSSGAKMADFGLSCVAKTRTGQAVNCQFASGTPGYACPKYITTGKVTEGSEVYSFGMVVLEVLTSLVPAGMVGNELKYPIKDAIRPGYPGTLDRAMNTADPTAGWPTPVALEIAALGLCCISQDESQRPGFNVICKRLRGLQAEFPATYAMIMAVPPPLGAATPQPSMRPPFPCGPMPQRAPCWDQHLPGPPPPGPQAPVVRPGMLIAVPGPRLCGPQVAFGQPPHMCHSQPGAMGFIRPGAAAPNAYAPIGVPPGTAYAQRPPARPQGLVAIPVPAGVQIMPQPALKAVAVQSGLMQSGPVQGPCAMAVRPHQVRWPGPPHAGAPQPVARPPLPAPAAVEVALEVAYVKSVALTSLRPELRTLALVPICDAEGKRTARLGRACQPPWFSAVLADAIDFNAISREACDFCWGAPGTVNAELLLRCLSGVPMLVNGEMVSRGEVVTLGPGTAVAFCAVARQETVDVQSADASLCKPGVQQLEILLTVVVHCAAAPHPDAPAQTEFMAPGPDESAACVVGAEASSPKNAEETAWHLECVYSQNISPDDFLLVPANFRQLRIDVDCGAVVFGRENQPEVFEALLNRDTALLQFVSRRHFQLELAPDGESFGGSGPAAVATSNDRTCNNRRLCVTNLSQNVAVVAQKPLRHGEVAVVEDGDTLSFAHSVPSASSDETALVPFLTLRVVGPVLPQISPWVIVQQPTSLVVVGPTPPQEGTISAEDRRPTSPSSVSEAVALETTALSPRKVIHKSVNSPTGAASAVPMAQLHQFVAEVPVSVKVPHTQPLASLPSREDKELWGSFDKTTATACWGASAAVNAVPKALATEPVLRSDRSKGKRHGSRAHQCSIM